MKNKTTKNIENVSFQANTLTKMTRLSKWHAKRRKEISEENEQLIAYWNSIPWWKVWVNKPSFEERRDIVIHGWDSLSREYNSKLVKINY